MKPRHNRKTKYVILSIAALILAIFSFIPIRIAIASFQAPYPQAFLTLGGEPKREEYTAELAKYYPALDVWISSGSPAKEILATFKNADIPRSRLHLDYRAADTVTNFTSLVGDFEQRGIKHVYLITSDFHMPRAKAIGTLVLGSQGIIFTPLTVPTDEPKESLVRIVRDAGRSLLWIVSGRTGASLHPRFNNPTYASR
ncbi:YdcF family protein [Fortiea contorta]|uniref:YdcF family protein n=1 Tax=Fortiea contorta TaxID=1892405 RepID=UPI0003458B7B|nr:YdcF family protein [Fortiea contorta]